MVGIAPIGGSWEKTRLRWVGHVQRVLIDTKVRKRDSINVKRILGRKRSKFTCYVVVKKLQIC